MNFSQKIQSHRFLFTAELGPPRNSNSKSVQRKAKHFKGIVDAVNVTDNQTAIVRMSSIAAAKIALEQGLEPIVQMTCRDRNRLALQSDLLGMHALGLENVLCLTGDHQRFGDHPEARGVYDLDSIQLIATSNALKRGLLLSGEKLKTPPHLIIGAGANPFAVPLESRILRLEKKILAGAVFIQTQPVFNMNRFSEWMRCVREKGLDKKVAILAGVMPVKSAKVLRYMEKEVPGMLVASDLIRRMDNAKESKEEGVAFAIDTIRELREMDGVRGIHLMPVMWESIIPRIAKESDLLDR